jgi:tRNA-splicing ligase RtcB
MSEIMDKQHPDFPIALPGAKAETLMWAHPHEVEHAAMDQLRNISKLPWVHGVRVMPDVHLGKGATVGSVIAMKQAVSPSAVGVDIGCGMMAAKTNLTAADLPEDLAPMRASFEKAVPVGFNANDGSAPILKRDQRLSQSFNRLFDQFHGLRAAKISDRESRAMSQCGSLGGGNHFIEVCTDETGAVWLMLHSGSRNIGKELAERHIGIAKGLDHNLDLPDRDLAVFLAGTPGMDAYLHDLWWAQDYALLNRAIMMATLKSVFVKFFPEKKVIWDEPIQAHHNYVARETLTTGEELIVTRKGAISAHKGQYGLIPGSMGTGSFVVKGLGNEQGYWSASHGAGRKMSRNQAKKTFTVEDLAEQTRGVECRKDQGVVDEIPGAYKDLNAVIAAQVDLVEVEARLTTLLCVKG